MNRKARGAARCGTTPAGRPGGLLLPARAGVRLILAAALFVTGGCLSLHREPPQPGRTTLDSPLVVLPAQLLDNCLVVEGRVDRAGPYHFLLDTGSSVTLVTPEFAKRHAAKNTPPPFNAPQVHVRSSEGSAVLLAPTTLRKLDLGDAHFRDVPALIFDCADLSAHLGVKIDGVLGFPFFRETLLTLDYPHGRVLLGPRDSAALLPGIIIPFNNSSKTPLIPIKLGGATFVALIDSGSDAPLSLNPVGLHPAYAAPPRPGATVSTLSGDHTPEVGRLDGVVTIGDYALQRPLVELTDELSALGGEILKNFTVTFDQERSRATFYRESREPVTFPPRRSVGLSFSKTPAYWRVAGVVPGSPAALAETPVQPGELVTRINGEAVARWTLPRFEQLVATAPAITFTFLAGTEEKSRTFGVFELVP